MSKPVIILADTDDKYLVPLELKFVEELYEKIELEVITDPAYFHEYFSTPRKAEILVIGEELYSREIQKHNIADIFVLTEQSVKSETDDLAVNKIFKYTSIKEIFNQIMFDSSSDLLADKKTSKETQVVLVYSAIGGAGKTTVALGVSACLSQNFKKVLYVDAEYVQNFQYYLTSKVNISSDAYREFSDTNELIYQNLKYQIRREMFDYLPPLGASLSSLNIRYSVYKHLIQAVKATKEYDYIVVDLDSVFNDEKAELLCLGDKVILLVKQDSYSAVKTDILLNNLNCSDNEKYIVVCNCFQSEKNNALLSGIHAKVIVNEYVEYMENCEDFTVEKMTAVEGFQKIAYMLI